jgi:hypothetical protein
MPPHPTSPVRLSRKEFYELTFYCRTYAAELARYDQHRVNLKRCNQFNTWLSELKRYDTLGPRLSGLKPARPVARWQVMVILAMIWMILALALPGRVDRNWSTVVLVGMMSTVVLSLFLPEHIYGTTMELLQAKVLFVVDTLLDLLNSGTMDFSEGAFFKARENLLAAHEELRQQIDLAHR